MRVAGIILTALGILAGLAAFGIETTVYASEADRVLGRGVGNMPAQHQQLVAVLVAGFLFLAGIVLLVGAELRAAVQPKV